MSNQGASSFAWRAIDPGEATLTLLYGTPAARSGAPEAAKPDRTVTLQVAIAAEALTPETTAPDILSQMEHIATYNRTEPCGDCLTLTERLDLYRAPRESIFVLRRQYKDAPGGTLTAILTGLWTTEPGSADPTTTIYTLQGSAIAEQYRSDGDRLVQVDAQQIPFPSPPGQDTAFHKQTAP
jgi:NlpE N-terminal domain